MGTHTGHARLRLLAACLVVAALGGTVVAGTTTALAGSEGQAADSPSPSPSPAATATPTPSPLPAPSNVAAATTWLKGRKGLHGFALVDSLGKVRTTNGDWQVQSASVVKAMLLVAYLRSHPGPLSDWGRTTLTRMIRVSDNDAATAIYRIVGNRGLLAVARAARMQRYSVTIGWGYSMLTAADQARFFARIFSLVPARHRPFTRHVLSHHDDAAWWGIPRAAGEAGYTTYWKDGVLFLPTGVLVHQATRLSKDGVHFTLVVLTDRNPTWDYGKATMRGVARRLLGLPLP